MRTLYLDANDLRQLLRQVGVETLLREIAAALRADFIRWEQFDKAARSASHCPQGVIELMPISDDARHAFKFVNGHPGNPAQGLPTVMAFGVLSDMATGCPLLLSELTLTTALRTAATSALAAQVLARPAPRTMALIGNGAQAEFQALAFLALNGVNTLRLFDTDPRATAKLRHNLQPYVDAGRLSLVPCASIGEAVRGSDIVTTATADKSHAAILGPEGIAPGMHLNALGGDCPGKTELDPRILRHARVFVEYAPQSRLEGEIQHQPHDFEVTELWRVLAGLSPGRTREDEITVFDSVGFALEDFSALRTLERLARELGLGRELVLVPEMDDPKDLWGWAHAR